MIFEWELGELEAYYMDGSSYNHRVVVTEQHDWNYSPLSEWTYNNG